jgi:cytochrome c-type biogenesis protein CcmH
MNLWLGITALIVLALGILLLPVWRQKSVLAGRRTALFGGLGVLPACTLGLYLYLGAPAIIEEQALTQAQTRHDPEAMIKALEDKLKSQPADAEGWYALGRAYIAFQRLDEAEASLAKAVQLAPKEARMLSQQAEVIALKAGSLEGRPGELVAAALDLNYEDEKALELAGLAAFQKQKWAESLHFWRRLLKLLPKDSELHEAIERAVKIAETKVADSGLGDRAKLNAPEPKKNPH